MSGIGSVEPGRWHDYVLERGEAVRRYWIERLRNHEAHVLFVLGKGFDPRMCSGLETVLVAGGIGRRDVRAIEIQANSSAFSERNTPRAQANWKQFQSMTTGRCSVSVAAIQMRSDEGHRIGSRRATEIFQTSSDLKLYTDVIVDVSALPRTIYLPLIAKLLHLIDGPVGDSVAGKPNLHVFVSEDPALDRSISGEGAEETATYIHPFSSGLEMEATAEIPKIWIPILGEGRKVHLERIYDFVVPDEICPVLPSPARNPRRSDDLVLEYHEILFDRLRVEPRNLIYASERNPFEVYRQIRKAILLYADSLGPLGGCKAVLSALSSKLMSVGALLVAYELKSAHYTGQRLLQVGIAHLESQGYVFEENTAELNARGAESELFDLWLAGECYEP